MILFSSEIFVVLFLWLRHLLVTLLTAIVFNNTPLQEVPLYTYLGVDISSQRLNLELTHGWNFIKGQ